MWIQHRTTSFHFFYGGVGSRHGAAGRRHVGPGRRHVGVGRNCPRSILHHD